MGDGRAKFEAAIDEALASGRGADLAAARRVYADWLDEQNTEADSQLAAAQRWMAERGRGPVRWQSEPRWRWCDASRDMSPKGSDDIPPEVWSRLRGGDGKFLRVGERDYPTRVEAERALADALAEGGRG
jgi:hypothetical protein